MKNSILILVFLACFFTSFGQEKDSISLLETDSTWGKEIFHFPLGFAREINYTGVEEAIFPKGWGTVGGDEFWSYVFVWSIDIDTNLTTKDLEKHLKLYFDGVTETKQHGNKENGIYETTALFLQKNKTQHIGKIKTFDRFRTKKVLILNASVEQHYCKSKQKMNVVFRFSPKEFGHATWKKLNDIKLKADVCDAADK